VNEHVEPEYVPCVVSLEGRILDAKVTTAWVGDELRLVLASRSGAKGGNRARNTEYLPALEVLLTRLGQIEAVLESIEVVSRHAMRLSPEQRLLPMAFPIELHRGDNFGALRLNITEMQRATARTNMATDSAGGNNTKRIQLRVRLRADLSGEKARVGQFLAAGTSDGLEGASGSSRGASE
jgi:hypothetical protein